MSSKLLRRLVLPMMLGCTIFLTEFKGEADYVVYLTDFKGEDSAKGLFKDCKFTTFRGGSWKVYVTKFKGEADLVVHRNEFATRR
jgi:hypothetical protein